VLNWAGPDLVADNPPRLGPAREWRVEVPETEEGLRERGEVRRGRLPARYGEPWAAAFFDRASRALQPGVRVLDLGAGRRPTIPPAERPPHTHYVGMDVSGAELLAAEPGAYDDVVVGDVCTRLPVLDSSFDLIVSWQVLEHVGSLDAALENLRTYLRPGGRLVALLSGRYAVYAILSRVIPYRIRTWAMRHLLGSPPETKFPTHYDRCYDSELERLLSRFSDHEIVPRYKAGGYFRFFRPALRAYLLYENWICRRDMRNLATHYLIHAVK
jgi:SAM-dependent methyltransferase